MLQIVQTINAYLSDYVLVFLLVAVGLWYTVKTRFVQVRCLGEGLKEVFGNLSLNGGKHEGGMSSFQALATAIAAQVGTGAIVGCSGAILIGGPGAIFWMWVIAFFGMATIYAEATLAQQTRVKDLYGNIQGGPVYYITTAFQGKLGIFLAYFFAVAIILALGFFGCMVHPTPSERPLKRPSACLPGLWAWFLWRSADAFFWAVWTVLRRLRRSLCLSWPAPFFWAV